MSQEFHPGNGHDQKLKKVFHHLKLADILLIVMPMIFATVVMVIAAINAPDSSIIPRGALILMEIAADVVFCAFYGSLALILSHVTQRNIDFRLCLVGVLSAVAMLFIPSNIYSSFVMLIK